MKNTTAACNCPACQHVKRCSADRLFAALAFEFAQTSLLNAAELRIGTLNCANALKGERS